jgi:hypothetical protein
MAFWDVIEKVLYMLAFFTLAQPSLTMELNNLITKMC